MEFTRKDPLRILPYEAWVRCIQLYASDQPEGALPLLAVSSAWEHNLLSTPEIWNNIHCDGGNDEEFRTECLFHLSRNEPVDLVLGRNSGGMDIVIKYGDRIRSLTFHTKHSIKPYSSADILRFSDKLGTRAYPKLVRVHVQPPCYVDDLIPLSLIKACPALASIQGAYVDQKLISSVSPLTRRFGICGDGVLPTGIGDNLEALRIRCIPRQLKGPDEEDPHCELFTGPTRSLETFEIEYGVETRTSVAAQLNPFARKASYLFLLLSFPSTTHLGIKTLSVTLPWHDIALINAWFHSCPKLRELKLVLDCSWPTAEWQSPVLEQKDIRHLKKLDLSSAPRNSRNATQSHFPLIVQFFARNNALADLEELRLGLEDELVSMPSILPLLHSIKRLKVLHLTRFEREKPGAQIEKKVLLSNLHTLLLSDGADLQYLDVPNLLCLECTDAVLESYHLPSCLAASLESITVTESVFCQWAGALSLEATERPFPRLLTLRLTSDELNRQPSAPFNFLNLRNIYFEEGIINPSPLLNHFMLEILFSPSSCPNLHTIQCNSYPNWALAIAMFYRRNSTKGVMPIVSFWLQGQPHIMITAVIAEALEALELDSIKVITTAAGIDRVLYRRWSRYITFFRQQACQQCIMAGFIACTSTQDNPKRAKPPDDLAVTELLDLCPETSATTRFNPLTRDEWADHLQNTSISPDYAIKRTCGRHDPLHPVHIGSNTIDGASYDAF